MIRDEEIKRLTNYIKGLGLKVIFYSKSSDSAASWALDNSEIIINTKNNDSKTDIIVSMIHEIGHALHNLWEKKRELDKEFEKALDHVDEAEEQGLDTKKKQRKIILDNEIAGTKYWYSIYKETNMQFPLWKLYANMEFDIWQYQVYYETGDFPTCKEKDKKFTEICKKHKRKKYE